jgi:hypothetical protein
MNSPPTSAADRLREAASFNTGLQCIKNALSRWVRLTETVCSQLLWS